MTFVDLRKSQILSFLSLLAVGLHYFLSNLHKIFILHHLCPFQAWELCGIVIENHLLKVTTLFLSLLLVQTLGVRIFMIMFLGEIS